ncbi:hypothetical protein, partial [Pseudomonas fluorescens]|uniref:hypothetical protein n=1 Tax=Pseudomonas fluorescens TaxID=294 RepID=UPI001CD76F84
TVSETAQKQDQKIAACGSSYGTESSAAFVGAGGACDLLTVSETAQKQDQKIAACGSSYGVWFFALLLMPAQKSESNDRTR